MPRHLTFSEAKAIHNMHLVVYVFASAGGYAKLVDSAYADTQHGAKPKTAEILQSNALTMCPIVVL